MISKDISKHQVVRMAQLDRYPSTRESLEELVMAVCCAKDEPAAGSYVDGVMHHGTGSCPKPCDVRRTLLAEAEGEWEAPYKRGGRCSSCDGSGWVSREVNGYAYASQCRC